MRALLITAGAGLLLSVGTYITGRVEGAKLTEAAQLKEQKLVQDARDAMLEAAAEKIANIKVVNRTNETRLEREIVRVPDFSKCDFGPDVKRVLDDALAGKTESPDNGFLPTPDPAP